MLSECGKMTSLLESLGQWGNLTLRGVLLELLRPCPTEITFSCYSMVLNGSISQAHEVPFSCTTHKLMGEPVLIRKTTKGAAAVTVTAEKEEMRRS